MILGTVELGLDYGINNSSGKPSSQQALNILDLAWNNGIEEVDTAASYGDSEEIIGNYTVASGHRFLIDTKLPVSVNKFQLISALDDSCNKLKTATINVLYLHSFAQCKDAAILDFLMKQHEKMRIRHIGISVYCPEELRYIVDNLPLVDTIQFPFSLLDCSRWLSEGLLQHAKNRGKRLYARSIFLQGLIFKASTDAFVTSIGAGKYIKFIQRLAQNNDISVAELAFKFVEYFSEIDNIVIGCQTVDDLTKNLATMQSHKHFDDMTIRDLYNASKCIPNRIIDPRCWRRT